MYIHRVLDHLLHWSPDRPTTFCPTGQCAVCLEFQRELFCLHSFSPCTSLTSSTTLSRGICRNSLTAVVSGYKGWSGRGVSGSSGWLCGVGRYMGGLAIGDTGGNPSGPTGCWAGSIPPTSITTWPSLWHCRADYILWVTDNIKFSLRLKLVLTG